MSKHASRKAPTAVPSVSDDEDDDGEQLHKIMQREWNTVDFAGKCKCYIAALFLLLFFKF